MLPVKRSSAVHTVLLLFTLRLVQIYTVLLLSTLQLVQIYTVLLYGQFRSILSVQIQTVYFCLPYGQFKSIQFYSCLPYGQFRSILSYSCLFYGQFRSILTYSCLVQIFSSAFFSNYSDGFYSCHFHFSVLQHCFLLLLFLTFSYFVQHENNLHRNKFWKVHHQFLS